MIPLLSNYVSFSLRPPLQIPILPPHPSTFSTPIPTVSGESNSPSTSTTCRSLLTGCRALGCLSSSSPAITLKSGTPNHSKKTSDSMVNVSLLPPSSPNSRLPPLKSPIRTASSIHLRQTTPIGSICSKTSRR